MMSGGGAVVPWYLAGGISAANCIAAYKPLGAASLAASYINLANPGTYDLTATNAPAFNAALGWVGNGSAYLKTGLINPANASWSVIGKIANGAAGGSGYGQAFGAYDSASANTYWIVRIATPTSKHQYIRRTTNLSVDGVFDNGVFAMTGTAAYRNGVAETGTGSIGASPTLDLLQFYVLGANVNNGAADHPMNGSMSYLAIYNTNLTLAQVQAVTAAMGG